MLRTIAAQFRPGLDLINDFNFMGGEYLIFVFERVIQRFQQQRKMSGNMNVKKNIFVEEWNGKISFIYTYIFSVDI